MDKNLEDLGIDTKQKVYWNLSPEEIYQEVAKRKEGVKTREGALAVLTGAHTGRSPKDRFIVREPSSEAKINWGEVNQPISPEAFERLKRDLLDYVSQRELYVQDLRVCAHPDYQRPVRVVTEFAWHSLFAKNLFLSSSSKNGKLPSKPGFTVIYAPGFEADPQRHETRSGVFIALHFAKRLVLIGGTQYAGEMKKSIFTMLNFLLPDEGVFPMHCSANVGGDGEVALFFGLSGTGKTTLSADPERLLIGDDEHGWFGQGVFNFEGGCYAKAIGLKPETEPEIYRASLQFGTVLENVVVDPKTQAVDFSSSHFTENTRCAYPISHLENIAQSGTGKIPSTLFFLTYDAFGVLPPISRLTPEQAIYYFLLGYTAKVAGTEKGVKEPQMTFSACFGAPFLPRRPREYGQMLGERLNKSEARVWLLNTGITGGPYGIGTRMPLQETRALIRAAMNGTLEQGAFEKDPIFGLQIPTKCTGVSGALQPRGSWSDPQKYDEQASSLREAFEVQIKKIHGS